MEYLISYQYKTRLADSVPKYIYKLKALFVRGLYDDFITHIHKDCIQLQEFLWKIYVIVGFMKHDFVCTLVRIKTREETSNIIVDRMFEIVTVHLT